MIHKQVNINENARQKNSYIIYSLYFKHDLDLRKYVRKFWVL